MGLQAIISANQRLLILKLLAEQSDYSSPDYIIKDALNNIESIKISSDKLETELNWLAEQELIAHDNDNASVVVATLTQRGLDVAYQTITHPGVARPLPGQG